MEKRIDLTIENTVILLFSVLPVVDSLNGLLIQWNLPSIGTAYKMGVLGILCWYVIRNRYFQRPVLIAVAAAAGYLCFSVGINLLLSGKLHTPSHPIKLGFNILTFGALVSLWQGKAISGRSIYRILSNNAWLMIVMILVPYVLGLGNTIYHGGIGYKAFFYSNNELSVALLILFFFCLYRIARKMNLWNLVQFGGITVCMLLLSTKSAIAACILGVGAFCLEYLLRKDAKYRKHLLIAGGVILLVGHRFLINQVTEFWRRQSGLFQQYDGDILATFLSGRNYLLEKAWADFTQGHTFLHLLIGNGFCSEHLVEMDFIDVFFYLGIIGVGGFIAFFVWFFFRNLRHCRNDGTWMRPFGFLVVLAFSFLAGHTLFMATSGCYFVLMCCFFLMYRMRKGRNTGREKKQYLPDQTQKLESESKES